MHPDKVFILVNDVRVSLSELATMNSAGIKTIDARGCTALDKLDAPNAEIKRGPYCFAGVDARGYVFEGMPIRGQWRVLAGCRNFSIYDARKHWGHGGPSDRPDCLALVEKIAAAVAEQGAGL